VGPGEAGLGAAEAARSSGCGATWRGLAIGVTRACVARGVDDQVGSWVTDGRRGGVRDGRIEIGGRCRMPRRRPDTAGV